MDKLSAFSAFSAVAEGGSFSRAAKILGKTASAITKAISNLEDDLGVKLLVRTTHHTTLTEAGVIYLKTARQLAMCLEAAKGEISQLRVGIAGPLRVVSPIAFGKAFLAEACTEFISLHPQIKLSVTLEDEQINLSDGGYDLALRVQCHDRTISKIIVRNTIFLCASPSYLKRKGGTITADNLGSQDWLFYKRDRLKNTCWYASYQGAQFKLPFPTTPIVESDNFDFLVAQALAGCGIFMMPQWSAAPMIAKGLLVQIVPEYLIDSEAFGQSILAVYPSHHRTSRKVIAFVEHLKNFLENRNLN